jgi:hypothetical protein
MDRERHHHHHHHRHKRVASTGTGSGTGTGTGDSPKKLKTHARRVSWSTSTESASGTGEAVKAPRSSLSFPESSAGKQVSPPGSAKRVRYREQGVDELLQLKLHQALAATDDVSEGATIVLATGDGNVGQFSEDGFLGSFRLFFFFWWCELTRLCV